MKVNIRRDGIRESQVCRPSLPQLERLRRICMVHDSPEILERRARLDYEHGNAWYCFLCYAPCRYDKSAESLFECFQQTYIGTRMSWSKALAMLLPADNPGIPDTVTVDEWPERSDLPAEQVAEQYLADRYHIVNDNERYLIFRSLCCKR